MARLTDTQLIILSAASQRDDRGVELSANVKGEAARKVVDKLIRAGLLEEVRAGGSLPVWRGDDESGTMALRITKTGLKAIDVEDEPTAAAKKTSDDRIVPGDQSITGERGNYRRSEWLRHGRELEDRVPDLQARTCPPASRRSL
jgi:hypothetical protein